MDTNYQSPCRQFTPLREEHKDGLLFVTRMRDSIGKVSGERLSQYTRWYWKTHIRPHFFQEEKILLPYLPVNHPWAIKLLEDHANIRDLILSLDRLADLQSFKTLCNIIETHIRFEERQVFAYLEQILPGKELNNIYTQLKEHPVSTDEWKDVFWKQAS